jgi:hypothetical protein
MKGPGAMAMKMQIIIAIACLGLLMWIHPASAQQIRTYSLTVGRHDAVSLSTDQVDKILAEASLVLKKCNVALERKGSVGTFSSPNAEGNITNPTERDAVHRENFDIKVVQLVRFCRVDQPGQVGCAWDPPPRPAKQIPQHRSVIVGVLADTELLGPVSVLTDTKLTGMVWAHEFGHRTGLPHRSAKNALMACKVERAQINQEECDCFRRGPGPCLDDPPEPAERCGIGH